MPSEAELFLFDHSNNKRRIAGALRSTIDAHGPITAQWVGSAAKRVESGLRSAYKSRQRDKPLTLDERIAHAEQDLKALYAERAGTVIDEQLSWCADCGKNRVGVTASISPCLCCSPE